MAYLYVTEFRDSGNSNSGAQLQVGHQPAIAMQKITFDASASVQSAEFEPRTQFVRLHPTADCHVLFSPDPTATLNHMPLLADSTEYFSITAGGKLAVIGA